MQEMNSSIIHREKICSWQYDVDKPVYPLPSGIHHGIDPGTNIWSSGRTNKYAVAIIGYGYGLEILIIHELCEFFGCSNPEIKLGMVSSGNRGQVTAMRNARKIKRIAPRGG